MESKHESTQEKAVRMAKYYLFPFKHRTIKDVAIKFDCSTSTVGRYFKVILPQCNEKLADRVARKSLKAQKKAQQAFANMGKK